MSCGSENTVLVIDDEELNLKLLSHILTRDGFHVIVAQSAEDGLRLIKAERPCLVLMDIWLRGMDGLEATRRIKADPDLASIPVVAASAHAMEEDRQRAADAGCSAYLTKPFTRQEILEAVRSLCTDTSLPK